ncbi:para-aminobenzoate synthase, component I (plasmid) [Legionella adelaidensis]|uniref:aminodeoxychorismate synthase n=1 Tax=Legionella adelaidensis TaxID=45056 RepID=A0A0W0R219_9GAMM|nr:aminodeoxychorismate synthase component I [Legionella adelaidensis]KTC65111.1 para-aminobenzoate synthase, component I [Legionella adelaidensis]VEH85369.1 para-aminobenzoate synthase, component I [Legionella adelaidensis]
MNLSIQKLPYPRNLLAHYSALHSLPGFVLLQSGNKELGRYDILSAFPYDELKVDQNITHSGAAFEKIQQTLANQTSHFNIPFQGGAIGYVSYDFGAACAGIYKKPHPLLEKMPLLDMKYYDWGIIVDHQLKEVLVVNANQNKETKDLIGQAIALWNQPVFEKTKGLFKEKFTAIISKKMYQQKINKIANYLQRGRVYQVNFTQPFLAEYEGSLWDYYQRIISINRVPYGSFLQCHPYHILSFSPERFLLYDHGDVLTSPIKGSSPRSQNRDQDHQLAQALEQSTKNKAENIMIVDLLRNDLGKFAIPGSVNVGQLLQLQSYNSVHHLVSHIEAKCEKNVSPWEVFLNCFPGGSITGAPKKEAMEVIAEMEEYSRGVYCGAIGYFSNHPRFDFNIAIRTIIAHESKMYLAAGGGIVIDSEWEQEYEECYTKIAAFLND